MGGTSLSEITIGSLLVEVTGESTDASKSIDQLVSTLTKLRTALGQSVPDPFKKTQENAKGFEERLGAAWKVLKGAAVLGAVKKVTKGIAGLVGESTKYVEDLNLFTAAMGKYADEAQRYAETVSEKMGIDPAEWMRAQGVVQTLATGFGITSDRAAVMSKNLTQLSYDLASFYNLSTARTMRAVQSGIAGELEPMRRMGYDLSKARLEAIALSLGIDKVYASLTQAEKAELRYYAMLTQVTVAQGDMARTLSAPANQLRILQSQLTMASRAIGNIFIPMLNMILPVAIAVVKAVRMIAEAVASLFGFKLPEIDYSGLSDIGTGAANVADELDTATGKAKELKDALLGFDELNIISPPTASSGGAGASGGFDFELPQYDFLGGLLETEVDKIMAKIKPFIDWVVEHLDTILDVVKAIGLGIAAWTIMSFANDLLKALGFVQQLSTLAKLGIALMITGFTLEYAGAFKLGQGDTSLQAILETVIGAALGVVGSLLLFGTGPVGWTVGLGIAIVVALTGIEMGRQEEIRKMVSSAFYAPLEGGITITQVALNFENFVLGKIEGLQEIIQRGEEIQALRDKIKGTREQIELLAGALKGAGDAAKENIPELIRLIGQLHTDTNETLELLRQNIMSALAGSIGKAMKEAGVDIEAYMLLINGVLTEAQKKMYDAKKTYEELQKKLNEGIDGVTQEQVNRALEEWYQSIVKFGGGADTTQGALQGIADAASQITFEDAEHLADSLAKVKERGLEGKTAIAGAYDELIEDLKEAAEAAHTLAQKEAILSKIDLIAGLRDTKLGEIDTELQRVYGGIKDGMLEKVAEVVATAKKKWAEMSPWEQIINGGEAILVKDALDTFKKDTVDPTIAGIEADMKEMGLELEPEARAAMEGIIDAFIGENWVEHHSGLVGVATPFLKSKEEIEVALQELGFDGAEWAEKAGIEIGDGYAKGLTDTMPVALNGIQDLWGKATNWIVERSKNSVTEHKKSWQDVDAWWTTHVLDPIGKSWTQLTSDITSMADQARTKVDQIWQSVETWWKVNVEAPVKTIWTTIKNGITSTAQDAWNGLVGIWQSAENWWKVNVESPVKTTWTTIKNGITSTAQDAWNGLTRIWSDAETWWKVNIEAPVKTIWTTIKNGITSTAQDAWNGLTSIWSDAERWFKEHVVAPLTKLFSGMKLEIKLPQIKWAEGGIQATGWIKTLLETLKLPTSFPKLAVDWSAYAEGGFPTSGQLFFANENGASEMIGNIGNRHAVANNDQIVEAVASGVYDAVMAAMQQSGGSQAQALNVYLDGRQITARVEQVQRERGAMIATGSPNLGW
jgi:hypothetical protein